MKLERTNYETPVVISNGHVHDAVAVTLSTHNLVQLCDRALRDGRTPGDGIHKRVGSTYVGIYGERNELHYAPADIPSVDERVRFLERLIASATNELNRIDPDRLVSLRDGEQQRRIATAFAVE